MELKFVIPNMEKTFGNLEFAGEDKTEQRRINGRMAVLSRSFNLYSDVQRADDIVVILPAEAGEKHFDFEERVKLVNPRITAEGYKIGTRGFTNYILHADDIDKINQNIIFVCYLPDDGKRKKAVVTQTDFHVLLKRWL